MTEARTSHSSPFKSAAGRAAFLEAYDAALESWPVQCEELDIPSRFGSTHVIVSGPREAPPLVLLHGYMATSTLWSPNIADLARAYRVYAVDIMGQPSKSLPSDPIRNAGDYIAWLTQTLDALRLDCPSLVGMSYGGWLALSYATAMPQRVHKLVLLSAGGLLPMVKQFTVRGLLMVSFPTRFMVNSFMGWLGFREKPGQEWNDGIRAFLRLVYLGLRHFRMPAETTRVLPTVVSDDALRTLRVPTLVMFGDHEKIYDPAAALARARRLMPDVEGELVPDCSHDMVVTQHRAVDARVLAFLDDRRRAIREPVVA